jgi:hypothetical protein
MLGGDDMQRWRSRDADGRFEMYDNGEQGLDFEALLRMTGCSMGEESEGKKTGDGAGSRRVYMQIAL